MSKEKNSRWSEARYVNMEIPSYIPSEALVHENGQFVRAFLLRAVANDMQRMLQTNTCDLYFRNIPVVPEYDANGNRTNTPHNMLAEKRLRIIDEIGRLNRTYVELDNAAKAKEISRKIYFTDAQMETGEWGAILGARGSVHQQLEKETKCKIVLAGRGITNPLKDTSPNAASLSLEDPHVRITASSEVDLQNAAERIEWILSDDPEAVEFREKNRRRMAQVEGRYDPRTWVSSSALRSADGKGVGKSENAAVPVIDEELDKFLEDLE
ncbi:unnamed protein product [Phytomonas sp. Hart1]|nr:unnamed protein product [Phytomonas sp. Hart1]|eukprot:CCW69962.1 unnamed protein product [Phytomonas sp. isolate Hart1]